MVTIRAVLGASLAVLAGLGVLSGQALAGTPQFPAGDEAYHTYAEVTDELHAIAAAHPDIAQLSSIGTTYQGRQLWLLKISDHAATDEDEPEVYLTGLTHAREHLTVEQALALIHWLVDGYGHKARITRIVDATEVWVLPMVNPDGGEYDIKDGRYHSWRKDRQPTPGSDYVGTDINRNFGYHWACCGGSSSSPKSLIYHGPAPFSTAEAAAERDFVRSRVVDGFQQIRLAISFHSFGQHILFPYGYETNTKSADMSSDDRMAMVALAKGMSTRNGYSVMQESHWYITDGTFLDWSYGSQGILTFTMELYPTGNAGGGFYPPASAIGPQTAHNRPALLWFIEQAACPYAAAGLASTCSGPALVSHASAHAEGSARVTGRPLAS